MGIPKFFRYISERWPMISQLIEGSQIPEFDNLYLDMNSILHTCTHGNDDDVTKRMTEEEVFAKIFSYIDHLFLTIKPQKVFYMAIDGVAPRAKMNQQRSRRFRTAMDAENMLKKALQRGEEIPSGEPFDSNSITPGTEFMAKLTKNLKYFIHDKISNDSNWSGDVEIIFSGHEVPGRGRHKIMSFIRNLRSQDGFDNNTRHCIYGLDADLIMLSLSAHAPHFALLREEVVFGGRRGQRPKALEEQNFFLLHISLLREYMGLEFQEIADELKFTYDFERVLDDFILVMFVIGNDFLPNLPDLHLNKGAFPVLLQTFKEALLHLDGYINENGQINLHRLKVWLDYLSQFELMNFERKDIDVDWFNQQLENISLEGERKRALMGKKLLLKQQKKLVGLIKPWIIKVANERYPSNIEDEKVPTLHLPTDKNELILHDLSFLKELAHDLGLFIVHSKSKDDYSLKLDIDGINPHETEDEHEERVKSLRRTVKRYEQAVLVDDEEELEREREMYNKRFDKWKNQYYKEKLGYGSQDDDKIVDLTKNYVEGLQWVLYYYYRGCPSWGWYYQHHYAPRISDLARGLDQIIKFDLGRPFTPFEQLMAVLPERSKNLIPAALRPLMYDPNSPIIDFYPASVKLDMNGKTADWEAVVLLSFVDEQRLVEAMKPYLAKLTPEERERNSFGVDLRFAFNPQTDNVYKSPLSGIFADIEHNHCIERPHELKQLADSEIRYGLLPDAKMGTELLAGFPTLKTLPFKDELEYNESHVFQQPSRQQSVCLKMEDIYKENNLTAEEIAKRYINKVVYTRWPFLRESRLVSVCDSNTVFEFKETGKQNEKRTGRIVERKADIHEQKKYSSLKKSLMRDYAKRKAVILDNIRVIIEVEPVTGLVRNSEGAYVKTFSSNTEFFPLQLMVESISNVDIRYKEREALPISEEFPEGSRAIFLGDYAYGGETTINGYSNEKKLKITVKKRLVKAEPTIGREMVEHDRKMVQYYPSFAVAKQLGLNRLFLSRITSRFLVNDGTGKRVNVGIPVKFDAKNEKVLGYARKNPKGWEYSNLLVHLLREYKQRFPDFYQALQNISGNDIPNIKKILPKLEPKQAMERLDEIKKWNKFVTENFVIVSLESDSLTKGSIVAVEKYVLQHSSELAQFEMKNLAKVPREAILNPRVSLGLLRSQRFRLGDRVIYVQDSGKVPLFSKGTVVGYTTLGLNLSVQVLFDHELVAGNTFGGRLTTKRGIGLDSSLLLNITDRQFIYHSKASKKVQTQNPKQNSAAASLKKKANLAQKNKEAVEKAEKGKEAAHELLNLIQNPQDERDLPEGGEDTSSKPKQEKGNSANHKKKPRPKVALLKKKDESSKLNGNEEISPPNKNIANSVFSAVLNQYGEGNAMHPAPMPNGVIGGEMAAPGMAGPHQIGYQTLNPNGLPYHNIQPHQQMMAGPPQQPYPPHPHHSHHQGPAHLNSNHPNLVYPQHAVQAPGFLPMDPTGHAHESAKESETAKH
ncbi:chromatin-binding exonuclease XRN1 KNAG_0G01190 [Huiozyma naganishii CBS 8797]|uniref:5'-3' exoribonuclease 1 n=1 Tax=Huiozyma naganishii (strain ATCC MYA-139 / BCRC 22969 / CBS 8797 / KCTC 17520 / NBRC 10181 / NCYC 3082 / Yp74L-3) TaxID=1071383 RepID=J7S0V4_HUIN7|nr:hypothetical protein KNAG_0G01190 [Kazachstania naganishii CBS 8797]CCK71177.1 hypothetical protein KNAG_0G01190 [Kazachstania naganishii CBS 8797]